MGDLTIDDLARASGFTVRNIRSHHTRGLLPPPDVRGRTGFYGDEHLERLRLIKELQNDGLPLRLVERLIESGADDASRIVDFRKTVMTPLSPGAPETASLEQLIERFGEIDAEIVSMALELGALVARPDGRFSVPNPALLDTADEVTSHGVSLRAALRIALQVRRLSEEAAHTFVETVRSELWDPFDDAGRPTSQWPQIASAIDAVRPLSAQIFAQLLPPAIASEVERVIGEELREVAEAAGTPVPAGLDDPPPGR